MKSHPSIKNEQIWGISIIIVYREKYERILRYDGLTDGAKGRPVITGSNILENKDISVMHAKLTTIGQV